ncbi:alpha-galactosidase [Microbacterium sp.]|uniref:alpha-galactosidase n=1 Tax=Microbacterium sp. TaxID=51671 RepID=UPI003C720386
MPADTTPSDAIIHLCAGGVSVLLDARDADLPRIVHWGAGLGPLTDQDATAACDAAIPVVGSNNPERPPRVAILPEHHTGWTGRPGISGSFAAAFQRRCRAVGARTPAPGGETFAAVDWSPRFRGTSLTVDGRPVHGYAEFGAAMLVLDALDDRGWLELRLELELTPQGLLRARARLTNRHAETYTVEDVSLALPVPRCAAELLDFTGRHNLERIPQRRAMPDGIHLRENRRGRTAADSAYVLHLGEPGFGFASGEVWAVHTGWSGNHRHYAERVFTGEQVIGGGEVLLPGEVALKQGGEYETPWIYGSYGDGLDAVAHRFHAFLRAHGPSPERPVTLNVWEAVYFDHDLARLLDLAELAAAMGVERFVLDDGWFGDRRDDRAGLGDWVVSPAVWPGDTLHVLVDRVHELGMEFGLWFEPEMVNLDSDLARAHPEWIMASRDELPVESRFQHVLNLAHPGAYARVAGQMHAVLDEYRIDYIKWDHNRDLIEAGDRTAGGRPVVHRQTQAFYRLLGELRVAYPRLEIESCSSGGARVDLGVLPLVDRVWVSDNSDPHDRQQILPWTAQLVPLEYLGAHVASERSHTTGRRMDLSFRAGTALFGHFGIEWDLTEASDAERDMLSQWISLFKEHRALILGGRFVRVDSADDDVVGHGVVAPDGSEALFSGAVLDSIHLDPPPPLRFPGLESHLRYRVKPLLIGELPSGLHAPAWWGAASDSDRVGSPEYGLHDARRDVSYPGAIFPGDVLTRVGVASPRLHPDQLVLYRLTAVDQFG